MYRLPNRNCAVPLPVVRTVRASTSLSGDSQWGHRGTRSKDSLTTVMASSFRRTAAGYGVGYCPQKRGNGPWVRSSNHGRHDVNCTPLYLHPGRIGSLMLPNRLVRAATSETMATPKGVVVDSYVELYRRLAEGGTGLILTGHMYVDPRGQASAKQTGIHHDGLIPALQRATDAVHDAGGRIFAQIGHCGSQTKVSGVTPVAPSPVPNAMYGIRPEVLTSADVEALVRAFGEAARRGGHGRVRRHPHPRWKRLSDLGVLLAAREYPNRRLGWRRRGAEPLHVRGVRRGASSGRGRLSRDRSPRRRGLGARRVATGRSRCSGPGSWRSAASTASRPPTA